MPRNSRKMINLILPISSTYLETIKGEKGDKTPDIEVGKCELLTITGSAETCKSSLLFQAGVSAVSEGGHIVFIGPQILTRMPLPVHGMPQPDPVLLNQLNIRYMSDGPELVDYLSSVHQMAVLPDLLLIDDLHHFIATSQHEEPIERTIARTCALLIDTQNFLQTKSNEGCGRIIISVRECNNSHLKLYKKFLKKVYVISEVSNPGEQSYKMSMYNSPGSQAPNALDICFRVDREQVFLSSVQLTSVSNVQSQ